MVDVTAMLWRLHLLGIDTGDRFQREADDWEKKIDEEAGFYAFNDYHALMAFLGAGRHDRAKQVFEAMNNVAQHYIAERTVHKPGGGLGWRLLSRCGASKAEATVARKNAP